MTSQLVNIDNAFAATAHTPDHESVHKGSKIIIYLEFPTTICLFYFTMQLLWGYDDD